MTTLTRLTAGLSVLFGLAIMLHINPLNIALVLLSLVGFGIMLSMLWGAWLAYNWYNDKERL